MFFYSYFFSQDYTKGELLTGFLKKELIDVLTPICVSHQEARKTITDEIVMEYMNTIYFYHTFQAASFHYYHHLRHSLLWLIYTTQDAVKCFFKMEKKTLIKKVNKRLDNLNKLRWHWNRFNFVLSTKMILNYRKRW